MKKIAIFLLGILIGSGILLQTLKSQLTTYNEEFHEHANFALFIDGEKFDFNKFEFMTTEPCIANSPATNQLFETAQAHNTTTTEAISPTESKESEHSEVREWVHLHNNDGATIHVHKGGITYHDFFDSLEMNLEKGIFIDNKGNKYEDNEEKSFRYFLNNQEVDSLDQTEIRNLDRALITYGPKNRSQSEINNELVQVASDACIESGNCEHRTDKKEEENCGANEGKPFLLKYLDL